MIITETMIRELQKRVDVSYEEAERFLRRAGGNIDIAERHALKKENTVGKRFIRQIEKLIDGALTYRIKVFKNEDLYMNAPILAVLILLIIAGLDKLLFIVLVFIVATLFTDSSITINKVVRTHEFSFRTVDKDTQTGYKDKVSKDKVSKDKVSKDKVSKDKVSKDKVSKDKARRLKQVDGSSQDQVIEKQVVSQVNVTEDEQGIDLELKGDKSKEQFLSYGEYKHEDEDDDDYYEVTIDK